MAQRECTGTAAVVFSIQAQSRSAAYHWCTRQDIQAYLDDESIITIGSSTDNTSNFLETTAKRLENHIVEEIVAFLSAVYNITTTSEANVLVRYASLLTAAQIGMSRMGASIGNELAHWTIRYQNQAWAGILRLFANHSLEGTGITKKDIPFHQRLLMAKTRERNLVTLT